MSMVIDGDLSVAVQLPDALTGAVFGPDVTRTYVGTREACVAKKDELELDGRGVKYDIQSSGASPLWELTINFVGNESEDDPSDPGYDPEAPINIVWRLTAEFAEIDYRKVGRYEQMLAEQLNPTERKEWNAFLERCLSAEAAGANVPAFFPSKTAPVQALLTQLSDRFERGKSTIHVHFPVLTRDTSFSKEANYRASITAINVVYTSAALNALYPEIPAQFEARMPSNGGWKVTRNDWEIESSGQGRESLMFTWGEYHDPEDTIFMTVP